jgi:hypothetical protein
MHSSLTIPTEPPIERIGGARERMSANLRHLPFSVHYSDAEKPKFWVEIVYQLLSICSNVTMIIMIEA